MCIQRASQNSSGTQSVVLENSFPTPVKDSCSSHTRIPCSGPELLLEGSRKFPFLGRVKPEQWRLNYRGESIIFLQK